LSKSNSHRELAIAFAVMTITTATVAAQLHPAAYRHHQCDCCGVDSSDDGDDDDVVAYQVPMDHAKSYMSDSDSTCHRLMNVAMT